MTHVTQWAGVTLVTVTFAKEMCLRWKLL